MFKFIVVAALVVWMLSRLRLWKRVFNLRRELRQSVRQRSFGRYYVAIRWREIAGFAGFGLTAFSGAREGVLTYGEFGRWVDLILYILYAGTALYGLYLVVDGLRLRRRFTRLLESLSRRGTGRRTAARPASSFHRVS